MKLKRCLMSSSLFVSQLVTNSNSLGDKRLKMGVKFYYPSRRYLTTIMSNITCRHGRSRPGQFVLYFCLFILGLLVFNGRPKFIFRPHFHIPWLTDVQHVQPLHCTVVPDQPYWPRVIQPDDNRSLQQDDRLTVVIVTARPEFKRLPLTLAALVSHLDVRRLFEVIFLVPPKDVSLLEPFFNKNNINHWPWSISIVSDDYLLKHIHTDSYRLQMIFKLILAQIIKTEYYMILDSDCVAIWPIHVEQLLIRTMKIKSNNQSNNNKNYYFKAFYQIEERSDRDKWWPESEQLLQIEPNTCVSTAATSNTIGVTPIILSKSIALRTLCRLQFLYGDKYFLNKLANWALWRVIFDRMWTEYTLYYLTARCTKTFDMYHFRPTTTISSLNFYGLSVWWRTDWTSYTRNQLRELINIGLKWRHKENEQVDGELIVDLTNQNHNLFTILQGRQYIDPNLYHELFYPIFLQHLKQQHNTQQIVTILEHMSDQFISI